MGAPITCMFLYLCRKVFISGFCFKGNKGIVPNYGIEREHKNPREAILQYITWFLGEGGGRAP